MLGNSKHNDGTERRSVFALGLLAGSLLGAGIALLTAPKAGVDTRRQLRHSVRRFRSKTGLAAENLRNTVSEKTRKAGHRAGIVLDGAKDQLDSVGRSVKKATGR